MPRTGGSEWYCQQLSKRLAERGHEVHVFTSMLDKTTPFNEEKDGFHIHRYPCAGIIWRVNPATFITHRLMNDKADVIHAHSYIFLTSNQVALTKKLTGVPFLLHLHGGIDWAPPTGNLSTHLLFHIKKRLYDPTLGKWTVQMADAVASVSKRDIELAKKLWGIDAKTIQWIPNAVDTDGFNRDHCDDPLNVVFVGRLEAWKGVQVFLEVAKLVREERDDVDFSIVGDGSLMKYVRNNDHVKILGQVPHKMIPAIFSKASVLVLPSYMEGLSTVCLEALAAEVPVVASNVGGSPEVVINGETGYLFPPGNVHLCAEKILRLLADERLRRRLGRRGRSLVERSYTWEKVVEKTERLYQTIGGG